jgi:hypothetical protein
MGISLMGANELPALADGILTAVFTHSNNQTEEKLI